MFTTIPKLDELRPAFPNLEIERTGINNLVVVYIPGKIRLLVSYETIVGISVNYSNWRFTEEKFSPTTSRQANKFKTDIDYVKGVVINLVDTDFIAFVLTALNSTED